MKKTFLFSSIAMLALAMVSLAYPAPARAYTNSRMIDDQVFDRVGSMSEQQIRDFINSRPNTCLTRVGAGLGGGNIFPNPVDYFTYDGGNLVDAAHVIYASSQHWGINPQVIIATLQKEQSIFTDNDCLDGQGFPTLHKAMGQGCAEGGPCPSAAYDGFSQQVMKGAWQLKFNKERAYGNTTWDGDDGVKYYGYMTAGNRARCGITSGQCSTQDTQAIHYDGYATLDGQSTYIENGATAALYSYTPHLNQSFPSIFANWFGEPTSACLATGNVAGTSGFKIMSYQYSPVAPTNLAFTILNNTGSTCVEAHVWNQGFNNWLTHIATGMRAVSPTGGMLVADKAKIDNRESLDYIAYSGGGGQVEVHRFGPNLQTVPGYYDVATNLTGVSATTGTFVSGDFLGRGYSQLAYVLYSGGGGRVEVHLFDPSLRKAIGFYDVSTNLTGVSATTGTFVAGDFLGRGYDQLAYVLYSGGGGQAEVHIFNPSLTAAIGFDDVATNLTGVSASTGTFVTGDFLGRGYGQLAYVTYSGGSGRAEVHMFNRNLTSAIGFYDTATNLSSFDISQ